MNIPITEVASSSLISGDGYDYDNETLAIRFHGGVVYHYRGCSPAMWEAYATAPSKGKYFHAHIKHNLQGEKQ